MAQGRMVSTCFWTDAWVERLKPHQKLLFLYLLTNPACNIAGLYEISLRRMAFESGLPEELVQETLTDFSKAGKVIYREGWIGIKNFAKHQRCSNPNVQEGINRVFKSAPESVVQALASLGEPLASLGKPLAQQLSIVKSSPSSSEVELPRDPQLAADLFSFFKESYESQTKRINWQAEQAHVRHFVDLAIGERDPPGWARLFLETAARLHREHELFKRQPFLPRIHAGKLCDHILVAMKEPVDANKPSGMEVPF